MFRCTGRYSQFQLSFDLLESWIADNPDSVELKSNGESVFKELALFQDYHGLPAFKNVSCNNKYNYLIIDKSSFSLIINIS